MSEIWVAHHNYCLGEALNIKKLFLGLVAIVAIFFTYNYLQPMGSGLIGLDKSQYSLKTHIDKDNKWSTFIDESNGKFFVRPGDKNTTKGIITFKKNMLVVMDFSIRKGSPASDIEFTVKKNMNEIDNSVVTEEKTNQVLLKVKNGDKVEIIAAKHGKASYNHSNLKIITEDPSFELKNFIIPFLWSILFIFLFGKKHTYIALNSYIIFILILFAEKLNFGALSFGNILIYMLLVFSMTFIFTLIYQELAILKKARIALILSYTTAFIIYIIPLFFIIYSLNFDTKVTKDVLYAVFQSNSSESYEYISDFISTKYILFFIFITSIIGFLLYKQERKETEKIEKSLLIFIIITFLSIVLTQFSQLRLPNFVKKGFDNYSKELKLFMQVQERRKTGEIKYSATKKAQEETYIIVIGESLNKKHMGIYGYLRDTTPLLSKMNDDGELIVFNKVYSNHTHTVPVLSKSLTEANQYNKKTYYNSLSIIEILNKSDIETYWLTNQNIYGIHDNPITVIASLANKLIAIRGSREAYKTEKHDAALIDKVKKVLADKSDKNKVIFVHLMGNHGKYTERYPKEAYSIYSGKLKLGEFGAEASKNTNINSYDNSIVYNDYVVSSILKELQKEKGVNGFIYMSDHADDAIRNLGHNSAKFTYEMTQVPMIAWFSNEYKKKYRVKYSNFFNRTNQLFSNDMFYDTLIGMFGINTNKYNSKYDFTSNDYKLNLEDALVLHGQKYYKNEPLYTYNKKYYTDKSNYIFWQKENTQYLIDTNQSSRIFPHRVNSIGKLHDIWNDGFNSFEVDVRFGDNSTTTFQVGHDHGMTGVDLDEFLSSIDYTKIVHIWLDFKNLNESNYRQALERLEVLDKKFNIKSKLVVKSSTKSNFFKQFKDFKWHTSYYLPTDIIVDLIARQNDKEMGDLSLEIAEQVKSQNLSGVSFDNRVYPFVKRYLEPKISNKIVYHTWYAPSLSDTNFKDKLIKNKVYMDERVKTLLSVYKSQFDL